MERVQTPLDTLNKRTPSGRSREPPSVCFPPSVSLRPPSPAPPPTTGLSTSTLSITAIARAPFLSSSFLDFTSLWFIVPREFDGSEREFRLRTIFQMNWKSFRRAVKFCPMFHRETTLQKRFVEKLIDPIRRIVTRERAIPSNLFREGNEFRCVKARRVCLPRRGACFQPANWKLCYVTATTPCSRQRNAVIPSTVLFSCSFFCFLPRRCHRDHPLTNRRDLLRMVINLDDEFLIIFRSIVPGQSCSPRRYTFSSYSSKYDLINVCVSTPRFQT